MSAPGRTVGAPGGVLGGARRIRDRTLQRIRQRGRSAALRALRLTATAVLAYVVAHQFSPNSRPLLAPLTALLVVQLTLYATLTTGARRVVSVVVGVVVAVGFASFVRFDALTLGVLIAVSIAIGQLLRLGDHLLEVPISAMLVMAVGGQDAAATGRISETLVGAGVGVVANVLLPPPVASASAGATVRRFASELAALLEQVASDILGDISTDVAQRWTDEARRLNRHVPRVERALTHAEESRKLNPRAVGTVDTLPAVRSGLDALEHCTVAVRGVCRAIADRASTLPADDELAEEVRLAFAVLLRELAEGIRSFGDVLRAEAESLSPTVIGDEDEEEQLKSALESIREARVRLTELLLVDPRDDPGLWELHGSLLASVDRVLRELDVDERVRARERARREALQRPSLHAVDRFRATTRHVTETPRWRRGRTPK